MPQPKYAEEYFSLRATIDRYNCSRWSALDVEKKFRTQKWDMRVSLSVLSTTIVGAWRVVKVMLGKRCKVAESTFCTKLAEEMIEMDWMKLATRRDAHQT